MRVRFGDFVLDTERHELLRYGDRVHLPPKTFQLLQILAEERPKAVAQEDLYDRLWPKTFVEKSNLHNLIYQLREALDDGEQTIIRTASLTPDSSAPAGPLRKLRSSRAKSSAALKKREVREKFPP
ncbi:MAG: hypothetical protein DMF58_18570 [Acidobacteria bacterium]|nr:MAG: hypothetical protein DMF58_18570 [Acidobacteriota bacterium]